MNKNKSYNSDQLRDYSSLFSRSSVLEWMNGDFSSMDFKIDRYDKNWLTNKTDSYLGYLKYVYGIMNNHYQNEYILKNSFINDCILKEIGETDSTLFNEFRMGNAIADLAIFNGTSKVFEIKTEYDTDKRLNHQLENYRKAFNQIYLIIPSTKIKMYEGYDKTTGIITFDKNEEKRFCVYRKAHLLTEVDPKTIMHILHTSEYLSITKEFYGYLPKMTSFSQFKICSDLISRIPLETLNKLFIAQMKKRGTDQALSSRYYKEFNQLSLALKMNKHTRNLMLNQLRTPLKA